MGIIIGSDKGNASQGSLLTTGTHSYNRELILDLSLEAFSLYDMGHQNFPVLNDYVPVLDVFYTQAEENITNDAGQLITNDAAAQITAGSAVATNRNTNPRQERIKYLCTTGTSWTLAEYRDYSFLDWVSFDSAGVDFFSYLVTGYDLGSDMMKNKHAPYILVYCDRTESHYILTGEGIVPNLPSSCIVQVQWDWCNSAATGKWGTKFQAYRLLRPLSEAPLDGDVFNYGERVIVTKNKLRGKGRALSLFIQSETGKDMRLLGWGILATKAGEP